MMNCKRFTHYMKITLTCITIGSACLLTGCTTTRPSTTYGMNEKYLGYVPARIAVLPCITWPALANFAGLQSSNSGKDIEDDLCSQLDISVIQAFNDQPYMKGFTPNAVQKLLQRENKEALLTQIVSIWSEQANACNACKNPPSYYNFSVAENPAWKLWLNGLSQATRNSDAVLLPFVLFTNQELVNDRGILMARRSAGITILLIDSNNGDLLWSAGRLTENSNKAIALQPPQENPTYPQWHEIFQRLLVQTLWKDFPGRLIF
ncbi:MAG: hypothetical protein R3B45_15930 [Bdellovibrionota bacterium]